MLSSQAIRTASTLQTLTLTKTPPDFFVEGLKIFVLKESFVLPWGGPARAECKLLSDLLIHECYQGSKDIELTCFNTVAALYWII